jgi:hypothetical protein
MAKKVQNIDLNEHRYGLFVNKDSIDLDILYGRHFISNDNTQEIILYRINVIESKSHALYGQSKASDKKYFPPVTLLGLVKIEDSKQENYGGNPGGIVRDDTGNLTFSIYLDELREKNVDISRGDIIGYNMSGSKTRYYEVENANVVSDETSKTIGGFVNYWKKVIATPAKSDVIGNLTNL